MGLLHELNSQKVNEILLQNETFRILCQILAVTTSQISPTALLSVESDLVNADLFRQEQSVQYTLEFLCIILPPLQMSFFVLETEILVPFHIWKVVLC